MSTEQQRLAGKQSRIAQKARTEAQIREAWETLEKPSRKAVAARLGMSYNSLVSIYKELFRELENKGKK